jgi:uncharacterized protein (TIGR03382 family)
MPRDGGAIAYAAKGDQDAGRLVFGGGNGGACDFRLDLCSMGPMKAGGGSTLALSAAGLALLLRRRRNRNRR